MRPIYQEYIVNDLEQLVVKAKELGATTAAVVDTAVIPFSETFRAMCEQNACGKYGANWMCPPGVGTFEDLKARILSFSGGVVYQTICQLQDSFDFEGMERAAALHNENFERIVGYLSGSPEYELGLSLKAGACQVCAECAYASNEPCRFPDKAVASLEACCIDVNGLLTAHGLAYNNGLNTVSYAGLFLF